MENIKKNQSGSSLMLIIIVVAVVAVGIGAIVYRQNQKKLTSGNQSETENHAASIVVNQPAIGKTEDPANSQLPANESAQDPVCGNNLCEAGETAEICVADCASVDCVKEGNPIHVADCCPGLVAIDNSRPSIEGCLANDNGQKYCANCGNGVCGLGENYCNCVKDCPMPVCAREGEAITADPKIKLPEKCCAGLTKIENSIVENKKCFHPTIEIFYCAQCGDGICGAGENQCNCPEDCSK